MEHLADNGHFQDGVLSQESIEVLLGIVDDIDDLDEDEVVVIESLVRALPPDSIYDMQWLESKLDTDPTSASQSS